MSGSVQQQTDRRHVRLPEIAERMAKAEVRKPDPGQAYRERVGRAIQQARSIVGWSLKEFAGEFKRDERLVKRWETGEDRPPFDELLFHQALGPQIVAQLARMVDGCEVRTTIEVQERRPT